jgi:hypothetical protein
LRFLLTSAGSKNGTIRDALVDLLGKPIAESSALCIPTAIYAFEGGVVRAWQLIARRAASPLCELGWKSLGVLELTAAAYFSTSALMSSCGRRLAALSVLTTQVIGSLACASIRGMVSETPSRPVDRALVPHGARGGRR